MQKRRDFASWRHLVPIIFVLTLFSSFILYLATARYLPFYIIAGSYIIANIIATFWEAIKQSTYQALRKYNNLSLFSSLLLPLVYFTLHFSYGLGSICGFIYFWNKWNNTEIKDYHFNRKQFIACSQKIKSLVCMVESNN